MAALNKFTFATDFAVKIDPDLTPSVDKVTLLAAEEAAFAKGKAEGLEEGFAKGQNAMLSSFEQQISQTVTQLNASTNKCLSGLATESKKHHDAFAQLAMTLAKKLAGEALEKYGFTNVESMIRYALKELNSTPHIVLRVATETAEELEKRIGALKAQTGFQGKVIILPEEGLHTADCRIEWADGALVRSQAEIEASISSILGIPLRTRPPVDSTVPEAQAELALEPHTPKQGSEQ